MVAYLFSRVVWVVIAFIVIFLILAFLDFLDEDEFIAEQRRIEKEENV